MNKELIDLKKYLTSGSSENSKDHLIFPLFRRLFPSNKFKKQADAAGADLFIEGRLLIELKTKHNDWLSGFYQALHYQKKGLSYSAVCVISQEFIGLWHLNALPTGALKLAAAADANLAPNVVGVRNAGKTNNALAQQILDSARFLFDQSLTLYVDNQLFEFEDALKNIDEQRNQINPENFLRKIGILKQFFSNPLHAIHCFYTILPYWDVTSKVPMARPSEPSTLWLNGKNGSMPSDAFQMDPRFHQAFRTFVEEHYVFTNDVLGINIDYYFSRFDEALAEHDPIYVKQHGIFFTDINLSRFALWFIRERFGEKKLSDKYIVVDPAGGSGNLISSWRRNHLKFKIVSELNPDLLKTIELRLKNDPVQIQQGYSIIPKTHENKGLNFIDKSAREYYEILESYLLAEGKQIDKPFAFLLNPPYKNTDENETGRSKTEADYPVDSAILSIAGQDAGKERYIAFLAQILELSKLQKSKLPSANPIVLIFTPTPWLIPRPAFSAFRSQFDNFFKFHKGFMVTGSSFFKGVGRWPVAFSIWEYNERKNQNRVKLLDLTDLRLEDLASIPWNNNVIEINAAVKKKIRGKKEKLFDSSRGDIRAIIPQIKVNGTLQNQPRYNMYRNRAANEANLKIISGFPLNASKHHEKKDPYGFTDGQFVGFMMDGTPCRLRTDTCNRLSQSPDRVWFKLDNYFKNTNFTAINSGPPDKYGFCAYDLPSAKALFSFYAITRVLNGVYPIWANQFDIWPPKLKKPNIPEYHSLCFALALVDNRCVVMKFEKDNPTPNAQEIFVDNPLCPTNPNSFWSTVLADQIVGKHSSDLVAAVTSFYDKWNTNYCKGQLIPHCGLSQEPYFKYFKYPDFVTPHSGLIQIRKYAEVNGRTELISELEEIKELSRKVREHLYKRLVTDFKYFD